MHKAGTERGDGTKRDGSEPEDTTAKKKRNKKKYLGLGMGDEAYDEDEEPKGDNRRKTIQKPLPPYKIGIQRLREEFVNANNKGMITKEEYNRFSTLYNNFISAKGNQSRKSQIIKDAIDVYREVPFTTLKDAFKNQ
jgi:two-component SAPR family response regulator